MALCLFHVPDFTIEELDGQGSVELALGEHLYEFEESVHALRLMYNSPFER